MELLAWCAERVCGSAFLKAWRRSRADCFTNLLRAFQVTLQGDVSLSGGGMQVERVKALNERMGQLCPTPNSRQADAVTPEPGKSSGNPPRRRIRSTSAMSGSGAWCFRQSVCAYHD